MLYVVDASVVVKWFLPEPHRDKTMKLLVDFRNMSVDLRAPDHIVAEVASALWKRSTIKKEISASEAADSHADFLAVGLNLHPAPSLVGAALKVATQEHHSPYDMLYVILALQLGCEFITADKTVVNKLGRKFAFIRWLGDL